MTVPPTIGTVTLSLSNVHVLLGEHPVLVDTGSPGEIVELRRGLAKLGVKLGDVRCAVVTHGHADHAGGAHVLQQLGIKIIAGSGDLWREIAGVHGHLTSTSIFATFLKVIIPGHYQPFWPDVRVPREGRYDLHDCGVDGEVIAMPGHTAGSLVVLVAGGKTALVGDLFRGGALAGYVHPSEPKEHFYQDDIAMVHHRIHELLARGVDLFVMGHGGPSKRADVERVFGAKD
jgi:glyoxylase-like metal-dependent hydrolase (beta-lactamase superfamily II)